MVVDASTPYCTDPRTNARWGRLWLGPADRRQPYQLPFWQPPPEAPVCPVGVHSRLTTPLASLLTVNVWPSVAFAVTVYSSNGDAPTVTVDRHALLLSGQMPTIVFSYCCRFVIVMPS